MCARKKTISIILIFAICGLGLADGRAATKEEEASEVSKLAAEISSLKALNADLYEMLKINKSTVDVGKDKTDYSMVAANAMYNMNKYMETVGDQIKEDKTVKDRTKMLILQESEFNSNRGASTYVRQKAAMVLEQMENFINSNDKQKEYPAKKNALLKFVIGKMGANCAKEIIENLEDKISKLQTLMLGIIELDIASIDPKIRELNNRMLNENEADKKEALQTELLEFVKKAIDLLTSAKSMLKSSIEDIGHKLEVLNSELVRETDSAQKEEIDSEIKQLQQRKQNFQHQILAIDKQLSSLKKISGPKITSSASALTLGAAAVGIELGVAALAGLSAMLTTETKFYPSSIPTGDDQMLCFRLAGNLQTKDCKTYTQLNAGLFLDKQASQIKMLLLEVAVAEALLRKIVIPAGDKDNAELAAQKKELLDAYKAFAAELLQFDATAKSNLLATALREEAYDNFLNTPNSAILLVKLEHFGGDLQSWKHALAGTQIRTAAGLAVRMSLLYKNGNDIAVHYFKPWVKYTGFSRADKAFETNAK